MKPEIFLFLHDGIKPKKIIKMGYSKNTVYRYYRKYKECLEIYNKKRFEIWNSTRKKKIVQSAVSVNH